MFIILSILVCESVSFWSFFWFVVSNYVVFPQPLPAPLQPVIGGPEAFFFGEQDIAAVEFKQFFEVFEAVVPFDRLRAGR